MQTTQEKSVFTLPGIVALVVVLGLFGFAALNLWNFIQAIVQAERLGLEPNPQALIWCIALAVLGGILSAGFLVVQPNEARVLTFLGKYTGSVTRDGWYWVNPFAKKQKLSLKVNNFNSERLKVNDATGNPIEIAAVIVWRVTDSAKALFDVESYMQFIAIQAETAIRALASKYPYDGHDGEESLRRNPDEVGEQLKLELHERLGIAGLGEQHQTVHAWNPALIDG